MPLSASYIYVRSFLLLPELYIAYLFLNFFAYWPTQKISVKRENLDGENHVLF